MLPYHWEEFWMKFCFGERHTPTVWRLVPDVCKIHSFDVHFALTRRHHTVHRYSGVTRHHGDRKGVDYQPMKKVSSIYRVLDLVMGKNTVLFLFSLPSIQAIRTQGRFVISRFVSNFRLFVRIAGFASIVF